MVNHKTQLRRWLLTLALSAGMFSAPVSAYYVFNLPDPDTNAVLYGDGFSYSGPILDNLYPGGTGSIYVNPANDKVKNFAFGNTIAGKVDDELNVYSFSGGQETTNQPNGTEEAYDSVTGTGTGTWFSTTEAARNPVDKPGLIKDDPKAWDANLSVFADAYLNDDKELEFDPIFVFNNNEEKDQLSQTLLVWGQVFIWDSQSAALPGDPDYIAGYVPIDPIVLTLQNSCVASFPTQICFAGGEILGDDPTGAEDNLRGGYFLPTDPLKDPALFGPQAKANNDYPETAWTGGTTPPEPGDFVISGGDVCFDGENATGNLVNCDGSEGIVLTRVDHNLGADRISYMVYFPELADLLRDYGDGTLDPRYNMISTDVRLGCNSNFIDGICGEDQVIDNGGERAFWSRAFASDVPFEPVPEPSAIALLGIGMLGFGYAWTRSRRKRT